MLLEWLKDFIGNPVVLLIGSFTIIQIAPIKINPWTWFGRVIRKVIIGDSLEKIQADVQTLKKDMLDERVSGLFPIQRTIERKALLKNKTILSGLAPNFKWGKAVFERDTLKIVEMDDCWRNNGIHARFHYIRKS